MNSQTVWLPTALYTALIRLHMDDFTAIGFVNAIFGDEAESQIRKRRYTFIYRHLIKLHIPADHEHRFWVNVNTISGPM